jgi:crotonobetainyl-CoA:carnitine CoA-transferase CaiB-like acyl-CoA transferase
MDWFRGRDVSFAPVLNLREAFDDPHTHARGMRLVDERGREHIGVPIRFAEEPGQPHFTLPADGEHNREVLAALGYDDAAIEALTPEVARHAAR